MSNASPFAFCEPKLGLGKPVGHLGTSQIVFKNETLKCLLPPAQRYATAVRVWNLKMRFIDLFTSSEYTRSQKAYGGGGGGGGAAAGSLSARSMPMAVCVPPLWRRVASRARKDGNSLS